MKKLTFIVLAMIVSIVSVQAYEGGAFDVIEHKQEVEREQDRHPDHFDEGEMSAQKVQEFEEQEQLREFGNAAHGKY